MFLLGKVDISVIFLTDLPAKIRTLCRLSNGSGESGGEVLRCDRLGVEPREDC